MNSLAASNNESLNIAGRAASEAGAPAVYSSVDASADAPYKIKFALKLVAFIAATLSLSWFFQGWREVNTAPSVGSFALLVFGTSLTLLILGVMGYWTYFEEKSKGTLKKKIKFYENIHARLQLRKQGERKHHG
ncbi:MAG TPA: hypothetical protein V6C76_03125 [Drouetiella sp.]